MVDRDGEIRDAGVAVRSRVFLGSSSEAIAIGVALRDCLRAAGIDAVLWTDDPPSNFTSVVEWLEAIRHNYEAAVFIYSPDDTVISRGSISPAPRDNVIYELGFFQGALSRLNCFVVVESTSELKMQSDLGGMTLLGYSHDRVVREGPDAALHEAVIGISRALNARLSSANSVVTGWWYQLTYWDKEYSALRAVDLVRCTPLYDYQLIGSMWRLWQIPFGESTPISTRVPKDARYQFRGRFEGQSLACTYWPAKVWEAGGSSGVVYMVRLSSRAELRGCYVRDVSELDPEPASDPVAVRYLKWFPLARASDVRAEIYNLGRSAVASHYNLVRLFAENDDVPPFLTEMIHSLVEEEP